MNYAEQIREDLKKPCYSKEAQALLQAVAIALEHGAALEGCIALLQRVLVSKEAELAGAKADSLV